MNEKPKSIWKRPLTGWDWLWAWLIQAVATFLIFLIIGVLIPGGLRNLGAILGGSAVISAIISVVAVVFLGLLAFIHWMCSWKNFRRTLFAFACLVTLIALAYAEEDWRGWHAWNQFKHQWEAKGEKFDWQSVVPPPVPDDQNFAFSPVWIAEIKYNFQSNPKRAEAWYGNRINDADVSKLLPLMPVSVSGLVGTDSNQADRTPEASGNWTTARLTDLKPWQAYYRGFETNPAAKIPIASQPQSPAADVLLALSKFDLVIEQLRQDSARPYSRFPIGYDDEDKAMILLPHLADVKRCSMVLRLRAIAELQNGQADKALADVKLMLYLNQSIRTEPILISHLVRLAMVEITLQPIYEGLAEHRWSDAQLAGLDAELGRLDFLADYEFSMRGERIFGISETEYLRRSRNLRSMSFDNQGDPSSPPFSDLGFHLAPSSFFYRSELTIAEMHERWTLPLVDLTNRIVSPMKVEQSTADADRALQRDWPYNILARMIFPAVGRAVEKYARAQSSVDLARTAIALERYRLAHGGYPESLAALAPQFIEKVPHDVIGGGPLHYRLNADGQFVLYSIGWNERDDGGVVVLTKGSTPVVNRDEGDWVWRYPEKH